MTCAKAVQLIFQAVPKVPVRIGLHSGDVFFEDDNVFGDSVNIASRIESLGVASAVLFSKRIKRDIANQTEFKVQSLGEFNFKNVEKDMSVFALANEGLIIPNQSEMQGKGQLVSSPPKGIPQWIKLAGLVLALLVLGGIAWNVFMVGDTFKVSPTINANTYKSIAVLPFENLSTSEENQYFADGMMEDILNNLAKVKQLKVISRTSSMKYRDTQLSVPEIAEELNTNHILEGSVQRFGNQVKIVVQLIDANSDTHLWSEKYERELKDVFKIQSEVAAAISNKLKINLLPAEIAQINYQPTSNLEAYDLYLKANSVLQTYFYNRTSKDLQLADSLYKAALALEPDFALAKLGLARVYERDFFYEGKAESRIDTAYRLTQEVLDKLPDLFEANVMMGLFERRKGKREQAIHRFQYAADLRPNSEEALELLANIYWSKKDFAALIPLLKRLLMINSRSQTGTSYLAASYLYLEDYEKAKPYYQRTIELDSTNGESYRSYAGFYIRQSKFEAALKINQNTLRLNPNSLWANLYQGETNSYLGRFEDAVPYFEKIISIVQKPNYKESSNTPPYRMRYAYVLWNLGQKEKATTLLETAIKKHTRVIEQDKYTLWGGAPYDLSAIYAFLGEKEKAYYWLDQIIEKDTWMDYRHANIDPMFDSIRGEKRFQDILNIRKQEIREAQKRFKEGYKENPNGS